MTKRDKKKCSNLFSITHFKFYIIVDEKINIERLQHLNENHLNIFFTGIKLGIRVDFEKNFLPWQKKQVINYNIITNKVLSCT